MEKIDLRELTKMAKTFRACHRSLASLHDGNDFFLSFYGGYRRNGFEIPIISKKAMKDYIIESLQLEADRIRKRFREMGVDPIDLGRKKKTELKAVK